MQKKQTNFSLRKQNILIYGAAFFLAVIFFLPFPGSPLSEKQQLLSQTEISSSNPLSFSKEGLLALSPKGIGGGFVIPACDASCPACTSSPNICGQTRNGNDCGLGCDAVTPPDSKCPPTVSNACTGDGISKVNISWYSSGETTGYGVDIDNDGNWDNGFWNKGVGWTTPNTGAPVGFNGIKGQSGPLTLIAGNTYQVRVYYVTSNSHSSTGSFVAPSCPLVQTNNSSCGDISAPSSVTAGQSFSASITVNNTGTKTWTSVAPHQILPVSAATIFDGSWGGGSGATVPFSVSGGTSVTFNLNPTAPSTPNNYTMKWQMIEQGIEWFGPVCEKPITVTASNTLTVKSSGASNVGITSSTGHAGTTNYTKTDITSGTNVSLTAPATAGGNNFSSWSGCDSVSVRTCTLTMNSNRTVTVNYAGGVAAPTASNACTGDGVSKVNISWDAGVVGSGYDPSSGYFVDIDNDNNWNNGFWNKSVPQGTTNTSAPAGFNGVFGQSGALTLTAGNTYQVRVFYITSNSHSPDGSFVAPSCPTSPDLIIASGPTANGSLVAGTPVTFSGTVRNQGGTNISSSFTNRFRADLNRDGSYETTMTPNPTISSLATGATSPSITSGPWTPGTAGNYRIEVCADRPPDPNGVIAESNESNNCSILDVVVDTVGTVSAPTASNACTGDGVSKVNISWDAGVVGSGYDPSSGYFVDIDNDNNWNNGFWNKSVPQGTTNTSAPAGFNGVFGQSGALTLTAGNTYQVRVFYITSNSHSPDGSFVAPTCALAQPDLTANTLRCNGLLCNTATIYEGDSVSLSGNIANATVGIGESFSRFCTDSVNGIGCINETSGTTVGEPLTPPLSAGASANVSSFWTAVLGSHTIFLCADGNKEIAESNEGNNCTPAGTASVLGKPNLIGNAISVTGTLIPGQTVTFKSTVSNNGGAGTGSGFSVRFCIDNANCLTSITGRIGSDITTAALASGATSGNITSANWTVVSGSHTAYFCADVGQVVNNESSELDNCSAPFSFNATGPTFREVPPQ